MTKAWILALLLFCCTIAQAGPCLPGTLQDYINLGATGCDHGAVLVSNFTAQPGQAIATPIDPSLVQITLGGTAAAPQFIFGLNALAENSAVLESFFSFIATGSLVGAGIDLGSLSVSGTGSITGVLDVCADAQFTPPLNCAGTPGTATVFAFDGADDLSESLSFAPSSFFDVFVDLTIDGGGDGSASLTSAAVTLTTDDTVTPIPEPSTIYTMLVGFGALALGRRRLS